MSILVQSRGSPKTAGIISFCVIIASTFWKSNQEISTNMIVIALGASFFSTILYSIEPEQYFNKISKEKKESTKLNLL